MDAFNVFADDWDDGTDIPGFMRRRTAVGARLGAELMAVSLYEVPSGERVCPYHFEHGNEEWLLCVCGTPTLRTPAGERELEPGDVAWFLRGPEGSHQVINRSDASARVLITSTTILPNVIEYPDSGKVGVRLEDGRYNLPRSPELDYWEGERLP